MRARSRYALKSSAHCYNGREKKGKHTGNKRHASVCGRALVQVDARELVLTPVRPLVLGEVKFGLAEALREVWRIVHLSSILISSNNPTLGRGLLTSIRNSSGYTCTPSGFGSEPVTSTRPSGRSVASEWYIRATMVLFRIVNRWPTAASGL